MITDRGYDSKAMRRAVEARGARSVIPPKVDRRWKPPCSRTVYRGRNTIERILGRLKDFRRIATRYDKLGANFLAAVHLAAIVCYWI